MKGGEYMENSKEKLVAIVYPHEDTAEEVLETLQRLQKKLLIDIDDATYITKDMNGKVKVHQTSHPVAAGTTGGAIWGLLLGALFLVPILGMVVGATTGALAGSLAETGIDKDFAKELQKKLKPGNSALFMLISSITADKVIPELSQFGGDVIETNLSKEAEQKLQKELSKGDVKSLRHMSSAH